ncbi:hypothetical protein DXG03_002474 [Asterophora parasitica]|uniref:Uncharacterized protein n=1 Tax=Asterophora parasitica TaxID=117018 RepID=A0A9P7G3X4_9AGAR|nr:hypothetical protein DXG03_002474 [Asterophora parasitica]
MARQIREAFDVLGDPYKRREYDTYANIRREESKSDWSEDLKKRMQEREEWARMQEEKHRKRMEALREQRRAAFGGDQKELPKEVTEMVDAINVAINEARPGWLERVQKAKQVSSGLAVGMSV